MNQTLMNANLNAQTKHHVLVMPYQMNKIVTQTDVTFMDTFHLQIRFQNGILIRNIISFRRRRQPMEITKLNASCAMKYQIRFKVIQYNYHESS